MPPSLNSFIHHHFRNIDSDYLSIFQPLVMEYKLADLVDIALLIIMITKESQNEPD